MRKGIVVAEKTGVMLRPHYLIGTAYYEVNDGKHLLTATAVFPSTVPSIEDRMKRHPIPHVNVVDAFLVSLEGVYQAFWAAWNGIHLMCDEAGFHGTLSSKGGYEADIPIPADEEITLELAVTNLESLFGSRFDVKVDFEANYSINSQRLMMLFGNGYAIKK